MQNPADASNEERETAKDPSFVARRWRQLSAWEQAAIAASAIMVCWLLLDSWMLERVQALDPEARRFFRAVTDLGRPRWALIGAGLLIIGVIVMRRRDQGDVRSEARLSLIFNKAIFFFLSVAGSSAIAALAYGIIGRARPRLHDLVGPIEFRPMSFHGDYASFPSHHATAVFAVATVVALLAPRWRVFAFLIAGWFAATRFLIGTHYLSDAIAGALIGTIFTIWLAGRFAARGILFERRADGQLALLPQTDAGQEQIHLRAGSEAPPPRP